MIAALSSPRGCYGQGDLGVYCVPHPHCFHHIPVLIKREFYIPIVRSLTIFLTLNTFSLILLVIALHTQGRLPYPPFCLVVHVLCTARPAQIDH